MISITIFKQGEQYTGFEFKGHAGFAKIGKDIVCAAVSAIVINTANSIEKFTSDQFSIDEGKNGGYLKMSFQEENSSELKLLLDSMCLGLEKIQEQYGSKYIELFYKEV